MEFELTDEQKMVRSTIRAYAEERLLPTALKRDKEHAHSTEILAELAKMGFMGMAIPEEYGGTPLDPVSEAIVIEELSRCDSAVGVAVSVQNGLVALSIRDFGSEEMKKRYLPKIATGEIIGAFSLSEPGSGSDAGAMSSTAIPKDGGYVANGQKIFVTNGVIAHTFIVFLKTDPKAGNKGVSAFVVDRDTPGFTVGKVEDKMGMNASDTAELIFQNCFLPSSQLIGAEGRGLGEALKVLNVSRIGIAAQALGIAQGAYEACVKYANEREQFGVKIKDHQLVSNTIAEMAVRIEASRLLTYKAAWMRGQGMRHTFESSACKLFASETAQWVTEKAVQMLGGYGYITDFPVERFFREAKVTEIYEGTNEMHRLILAREIFK
jgi:alkylation response protein AidB-like acyl-CoA dehydrogenase